MADVGLVPQQNTGPPTEETNQHRSCHGRSVSSALLGLGERSKHPGRAFREGRTILVVEAVGQLRD